MASNERNHGKKVKLTLTDFLNQQILIESP